MHLYITIPILRYTFHCVVSYLQTITGGKLLIKEGKENVLVGEKKTLIKTQTCPSMDTFALNTSTSATIPNKLLRVVPSKWTVFAVSNI